MEVRKFSWTIQKYWQLNREEGVGFESPIFDKPIRTSFQLIFYPGGAGKISSNSDDHNKEDVVYLKMVSCDFTSVAITFNISCAFPGVRVINDDASSRVAHFSVMYNNNTVVGFQSKQFSSYLKYFAQQCTGELTWSCSILSEKIGTEPPAPIFNLKPFYENQELTDLVLRVGNEEFHVHKLVLASRSPVFKAMFVHDMAENAHNQLEIADFDVDTVKHLIEYVYTGQCENLGDTAATVLACAEKYDLKGLKIKCERALEAALDVQNAVTVLQLAHMYRAKYLKQNSFKFIKDNIELVMKTPEWQSLPKELHDDFIKFLMPNIFTYTEIKGCELEG